MQDPLEEQVSEVFMEPQGFSVEIFRSSIIGVNPTALPI
jgi:hypothetical protein